MVIKIYLVSLFLVKWKQMNNFRSGVVATPGPVIQPVLEVVKCISEEQFHDSAALLPTI